MSDRSLSAQQLKVIDALSSGATLTAAAEQAGVHRNTIAYWRRNSIPFQHALASAQYDRALLMREKLEGLADLAVQTLKDILIDPAASPSVRLKAALAVIDTIATPPPPKKQIALEIEKFTVTKSEEPTADVQPQTVHKNAQHPIAANTPYRRETPKIGRNEPCPCGSGLKYKRCCLDKPQAAAA